MRQEVKQLAHTSIEFGMSALNTPQFWRQYFEA
jgi:hypothetical protein